MHARRTAAVAFLLLPLGTGCADETALVAVVGGVSELGRHEMTLCLHARRGERIVFASGWGAGTTEPLPSGELSLTFVASEPQGDPLHLFASARRGAFPLGETRGSFAFHDGRVDRQRLDLGSCAATSFSGPLHAVASLDAASRPAIAAPADVDADGDDELVGIDAAGQVVVLDRDGASLVPVTPPRGHEPAAAPATSAIAIGDLNGDCAPDLVSAGSALAASPLAHYGETWAVARAMSGASAVAIGDWNGDGREDVVLGTSDGLSILDRGGDGTLAQLAMFPTAGAASGRRILLADVTGDGKAEVFESRASGTRVWRGGASGIELSGALPPAISSSAGPIAAGDLDADGDLDLAGVGADGSLFVIANAGDGSLADVTAEALATLTVDDFVTGVAIGDVTGDCVPDVVLASQGRQPRVLRGQRATAELTAGPTTDASAATEVMLLDVDGDGRLEVGTVTPSGRLIVLGGT